VTNFKYSFQKRKYHGEWKLKLIYDYWKEDKILKSHDRHIYLMARKRNIRAQLKIRIRLSAITTETSQKYFKTCLILINVSLHVKTSSD
jgi:hypothetical protein